VVILHREALVATFKARTSAFAQLTSTGAPQLKRFQMFPDWASAERRSITMPMMSWPSPRRTAAQARST